jgi:hypothetical protein
MPPLDDLRSKILAILDKSPFESSRSIAQRLAIVQSQVLRHFHESLEFNTFHLHWLSNQLTYDLRGKRNEHASAMLPFLYAVQRDDWPHLGTGNELWFFFDTSSRRM